MSELPSKPNRPHNYDVLQPDAEGEEPVRVREGGDTEGRGTMTAQAVPKITPGDELYQVVKGQELEQEQLNNVKARHEAQHDTSGFLATMAAYEIANSPQDGPRPTQEGFPEAARQEITSPQNEPQPGRDLARDMDAYAAQNNAPAQAQAQQPDAMSSFVTAQDRAQQEAENAMRPTMAPGRYHQLDVA